MRHVEVVADVAWITLLGYDKPVHAWRDFKELPFNSESHPSHGVLVAFHLVQGLWRVVSDQWPYEGRTLIQLNSVLMFG